MVKRNFAAVDASLAHLHEVKPPKAVTATFGRPPLVADEAPDFVKRVTAVMMAGKGDLLPVSAFPVDGTWPMGTARFEKRNLALDIPVWDQKVCIQCNQCALVCPHAAIRAKLYAPEALAGAPATFKADDFRSPDRKGLKYTIQVAPEDCTGCTLCVQVCPAKDKSNPRHKAINMAPQRPLREAERENYAFFLDLPEIDRAALDHVDLKTSQFLEPLFEYSGACAGCGETPYIKLLTQLFGDRALIANATGCSSIYGGNLPTTPYTTNRDGPRPRLGELALRGQRRVRPGLPPGPGRPPRAGRAPPGPAPCRARREPGGPAPPGGPEDRSRDHCPARPGARTARPAPRGEGSPGGPPREPGRLPRAQERLARGRRRLGLRHRLRRPRPRPRRQSRRQRAGARHRGLLEHGRPAIEGHPDGRLRQVRGGGQGGGQEGPRAPGHELRPRLRGPRRLRGQDGPDPPGPAGGGGVPRAFAGHRLQPLHRPRLRHGLRGGAAEAGHELRGLAALPLRPAPGGPGRAASPSRLRSPQDPARGLHAQRGAVPGGGEGRSPALPAPARRPPRTSPASGTPSTSSSRASPCPLFETPPRRPRAPAPAAEPR